MTERVEVRGGRIGDDVRKILQRQSEEGGEVAQDLRQQMESEASANAVRAAGLSILGSEEALIAQLSTQLDKMAQNARDSRQASRKIRSAQRRAGIADERRAARRKLAAGIVDSLGGLVASAVGSSNERLGQAIEGGAKAASAGIGKAEEDARADAKLHELVSQEAGELASDDGEAAQSIESFQEKARGHLEQIQRARMEARMAALRG